MATDRSGEKGKLETPFGPISGREWDGMVGLGADPDHINFFGLIRLRARADGITRDSRKTLALRMNRSVDFIDDMSRWHHAKGTIRSGEPYAIGGGPRGSAWVVDREALTFDEWPEESRKTAVLFWEEVARRQPLVSGYLLPKRAASSPEESRQLARRERQTDGSTAELHRKQSASALSREGSEDEKLDRCQTILAERPPLFESSVVLELTKSVADPEKVCQEYVDNVDHPGLKALRGFFASAREGRTEPKDWREGLTPDEIRAGLASQLEGARP